MPSQAHQDRDSFEFVDIDDDIVEDFNEDFNNLEPISSRLSNHQFSPVVGFNLPSARAQISKRATMKHLPGAIKRPLCSL